MEIPQEYVSMGVAGVFAVLFYLLRQKDAAQQKEMQQMKLDQAEALRIQAAANAEALRLLSAATAEANAKSETKISLLFEKHDKDVKELHDFQVHVADGHYKKSELDTKFERLETAFTNGFRDMGQKFDKLAGVLISHIQKGDSK